MLTQILSKVRVSFQELPAYHGLSHCSAPAVSSSQDMSNREKGRALVRSTDVQAYLGLEGLEAGCRMIKSR